MAKEDLAELGFREGENAGEIDLLMEDDKLDEERRKVRRQGFTAGLRAKGFRSENN